MLFKDKKANPMLFNFCYEKKLTFKFKIQLLRKKLIRTF